MHGRRGVSRSLVTLLVCAWVLVPRLAGAQVEREPIRASVLPGSVCASARELEAAVIARTPRARIAEPGEPARTFHVSTRREGLAIVGRLAVEDSSGRGSPRVLTASSCRELVDALALVAALAVDPRAKEAAPVAPAAPAAPSSGPPPPSSASTEPVAAGGSAVTSRPSSAPPGAASGGAGAASPEERAESAEPRSEPVNPPRPGPSAKAPAPAPARAPAPLERRVASGPTSRWTLRAAIGGGGATVLGGALDAEAGLVVRRELAEPARLRMAFAPELHGMVRARGSRRVDAGAVGVEASVVAAALALCPLHVTAGRARASACARSELGSARFEPFGTSRGVTRSRLWATAGVGAHGELAVARWLALVADLELGAPLNRETYLLEPDATLWRAPFAFARGALGASARIW